MDTVRHLLQEKGQQFHAIAPEAMVYEALKLMSEKEIGALLVLERGRLVGIISERDYARKVILKGKSSLDTPVREVMTGKVVFVRPENTLEECMALMTDKRVRHLPVLEGDQILGVISIGDLVKATIAHKDFVIRQLENYITGNR
jgi:CBS domain-containing protein